MMAPRLGAIPHSNDAAVKDAKQIMKKRLRPSAPANHPLIGRTTAFETRYDVSTQVLWSLLAPRLPAMYGSATLAMLVSSTSMNAASATTTATSHGLYRGRQTSWSSVSAAELIGGIRLELHSCRGAVFGPYSHQARGRSSPAPAARFSRNCQLRFQAEAN